MTLNVTQLQTIGSAPVQSQILCNVSQNSLSPALSSKEEGGTALFSLSSSGGEGWGEEAHLYEPLTNTEMLPDAPLCTQLQLLEVPHTTSRLTMNTTTNDRYGARNTAKPVNFYCFTPPAHYVCVIGDFNGWDPLANPMNRQVDGWWFVQAQLTHGYHLYCFLVDGQRILDPSATGIARNDRNEPVSLIAVS